MPAQKRPSAIAIPAPSVVPMSVRVALALLATLTLLVLFSPSVVQSQGAPAAQIMSNYRVQAGETIWSIAVRFYGDGEKWHEVARVNALGATGEKGLVVGQSIKVPKINGAVVQHGKTVAPPTGTPTGVVTPAVEATQTVSSKGALASQTSDLADAAAKAPQRTPVKSANKTTTAGSTKKADASSVASARTADASGVSESARDVLNAETMAPNQTRIWSVEAASERAARGREVATVFYRTTYDPAEAVTAIQAALPSNKPHDRNAEYEVAPFTVDAGRIVKSGYVGHRENSRRGASANASNESVQITDETEITLPDGYAATVGSRFVSFDIAPMLKAGVRIVRPTGILEIVRADAGQPIMARVRRQVGHIEHGQHLLPVEGVAVSSDVHAVAIARDAAGAPTRVVWAEGDSTFHTLQSYVVLAATDRDGVKAGEEFALVQTVGVGSEAREQRVGVARIVRVTSHGSSAVIIRQEDVGISVGAEARRIARVN